LLWRWLVTQDLQASLVAVLMPFLVTLVVLVLFHLVINLVLPLRWPKIRGEFERQLQRRLYERLAAPFVPPAGEGTAALADGRRKIERREGEAGEVHGYLDRQQQAANVEGLYGA